MENINLINPGVWHAEFDREGKPMAPVFELSYVKLLGYDSVEDYAAVTEHWLGTIHPHDRDRVLADMDRCMEKNPDGGDFDCEYRLLTKRGYRWFHNYARVLRRQDGSIMSCGGVVFDIQDSKDRSAILGSMPVSSSILAKTGVGMWALEIDEGKPPRLYVDESSMRYVGFNSKLSPESTYRLWYDAVDSASDSLVDEAIEKMSAGEHAELQLPWNLGDGGMWFVRFGGVRNYDYTGGIRLEGTLQNITGMLHMDVQEHRRMEEQKVELIKTKLRVDALTFVVENEPDLEQAVEFFGRRILSASGCDQLVFTQIDGRRLTFNAEGVGDYDRSGCPGCPFESITAPVFENNYVVMNNTTEGCGCGLKPNPGCPVKSTLAQRVYVDGKLAGLLSVNYLKDYHNFSDNAIEIMKAVSVYMGIFMGRIKAKGDEIARIKAEASDKAKTEFLFNMSHDIRTPMNAILGFTDKALRNAGKPEEVADSLKKVKDSGEYLLRIINDILDLAKIESGTLEFNEKLRTGRNRKVSLINMFAAEAEAKGISFISQVDMPNPYFWVDENRTNQIVANLISNAIKYTPPGGTVWYRVKQLPDEQEGWTKFAVSVEDTGKGMSPEFVSGIFDAFKRDRSAIDSGVQGTGLGMAIVKKLCDAMGAEIFVESTPGKGTKVTFIARHRLGTEEELAEAMAEEQLTRLPPGSLKGRRILLAEDNELNREIAEDILKEEGIEVHSAVNGAEAVQLLQQQGPGYYDFVLMDIQMPVMNGYEATRAIRALPGINVIPIIALSANAFEEDKAASRAAGMDDHVAKPINIQELMSTLAKYI